MSADQICGIIQGGEERFDYTRYGLVAWSEVDKAGCCGLVKDILAMANTLGGDIVIGVTELDRMFAETNPDHHFFS